MLFHRDFLVPSGLPSFLFFLISGKRFCSIMISWFLLVLAGVLALVSLLLLFLISGKGILFHRSSWFRSGFRRLPL